MNRRIRELLQTSLGEGVQFGAPLKRLTSFRVGGPADALAFPKDVRQLGFLMDVTREYEIPVFFLGRGTNLLATDAGFRGVIVSLRGGFSATLIPEEREHPGDPMICEVEAGVSLPALQRQLLRRGLGGFEFAVGIPGSVGGGLCMNAGTRWGAVEERTRWVEWMKTDGVVERVARRDLSFAYRHLNLPPGSVILRAAFEVFPRKSEHIRRDIRSRLRERMNTQPTHPRSAGCVFRNPGEQSAGRLIDEAGLKGTRRGGAMVSRDHANFILNRGDATAADILTLMRSIRQAVRSRFGVVLHPEVTLLGETGVMEWLLDETP